MKILLLGIFPRGQGPTDDKRQLNLEINRIIEGYDDGEHVHYLDISNTFLQDNGRLGQDVMPDALHPNALGYELWAQAMEEKIGQLGKFPKVD